MPLVASSVDAHRVVSLALVALAGRPGHDREPSARRRRCEHRQALGACWSSVSKSGSFIVVTTWPSRSPRPAATPVTFSVEPLLAARRNLADLPARRVDLQAGRRRDRHRDARRRASGTSCGRRRDGPLSRRRARWPSGRLDSADTSRWVMNGRHASPSPSLSVSSWPGSLAAGQTSLSSSMPSPSVSIAAASSVAFGTLRVSASPYSPSRPSRPGRGASSAGATSRRCRSGTCGSPASGSPRARSGRCRGRRR